MLWIEILAYSGHTLHILRNISEKGKGQVAKSMTADVKFLEQELYPRHIVARILWNPKVRYLIHKSQPPFRIHSQINLVYGHTFHFSNIHFNIILLAALKSYTRSHFLRFPIYSPVSTALPHTCYMPPPYHLPRFYQPNNIWWVLQIVTLVHCVRRTKGSVRDRGSMLSF